MSDSLTILVVDDNPSMASVLVDVLNVKGYEAIAANSGAEALEILRKHPVDVLLTDVIMPEMNGLTLYHETRKIHPHLTTFLMTAYAADDLIKKGMADGIKTVLSKPLDVDFLLLLISGVGKILKGPVDSTGLKHRSYRESRDCP